MRRFRKGALASTLVVSWLVLGGRAEAFRWPQEAVRIEAQLAAEDADTRRAAARGLARLTPAQARPLVQRGFGDPDIEVRLAAAQAALSLGVSGVGKEVVGWLHERDVRSRVSATEVLFHDPVETAIAPLGRVLADADQRVRRGAALALGEMGRLEQGEAPSGDEGAGGSGGAVRSRAAAQLLGRLDDADAAVRVAVIDSLARLGSDRAVLPLVSKVQDNEVEVRVAVARALGVLGDARASGALLVAARDRDAQVAAQAVRALGFLGDASAAPSLRVLSQEPTPVHVRRGALIALSRLRGLSGAEQVTVLEQLVDALHDPGVRGAAQRALTRVGASAAPALRSCLASAAGDASEACGAALSAVDPRAAVEAVRRALERGSLPAAAALRVLGHTDTAEALVVALEHLTHPEPAARAAGLDAALSILRRRGGDRRAAGPLLAAMELKDWSAKDKERLLESLGWSGDPSAGPALAAAASALESHQRMAALVALGRIPGHGQDEILLAALDDPAAKVRRVAALSLRSSGASKSADDLLRRLESREGQDREAVALALVGPLRVTEQNAHVTRAAKLLDRVPGPARDSLLEALAGSERWAAGATALRRLLVEGSPLDRAKLAESLHLRRDAREMLRELAGDSSAIVRAHAAFSLGSFAPEGPDEALVWALGADADAAVAGNALATVARWAAEHREALRAPEVARWGERLCAALEDRRAVVRANAVAGLLRLGRACESVPWPRLLRSDPAEQVRVTVARGLRLEARRAGSAAAFELRRCSAFERSRRVALACTEALQPGEGGAAPSAAALGHVATAPQLVFVAPRRSAAPLTTSPFVALYEDAASGQAGLVRSGWTDRRGAFLLGQGETVRLLELGLLRAG